MAESTTTAGAVIWLTEARADVRRALAEWERGDLAPVPAGVAWDVVRVPQRTGWRTVHRLRADGTLLGPVLHTVTHVEVLVPAGTARFWCAPRTTTLSRGEFVAAPDPAVIAPLTARTRSWIVAPTAPLVLTDPDELRAAYLSAYEVMEGMRVT
ncbi:hypothetical protein GCM10018785_73300 [Streptomyces longispororuber]|uniref:Uncharacterized protein n=1 Tax=Streptomyces longispororuber TaxID=68230 RepID=A0A919E0D5_9ACTN|nr:hypothetical protein [Streptomyces longispororuber]GHE98682.1 hypothetical protein GCM10018785_73300 [Streptomyces longispororuber]